MPCNPNYTGDINNFKFINLNVLKVYKELFPNLILGLSDHTPGHSTVLGAITLGAKIIEKHFTDDTSRNGPDHHFAMNPKTWSDMVHEAKNLEVAFGNSLKEIEENEDETSIIQRRCIRLKKNVSKGDEIVEENLICLRPCPKDAIPPYLINKVIGKSILNEKKR